MYDPVKDRKDHLEDGVKIFKVKYPKYAGLSKLEILYKVKNNDFTPQELKSREFIENISQYGMVLDNLEMYEDVREIITSNMETLDEVLFRDNYAIRNFLDDIEIPFENLILSYIDSSRGKEPHYVMISSVSDRTVEYKGEPRTIYIVKLMDGKKNVSDLYFVREMLPRVFVSCLRLESCKGAKCFEIDKHSPPLCLKSPGTMHLCEEVSGDKNKAEFSLGLMVWVKKQLDEYKKAYPNGTDKRVIEVNSNVVVDDENPSYFVDEEYTDTKNIVQKAYENLVEEIQDISPELLSLGEGEGTNFRFSEEETSRIDQLLINSSIRTAAMKAKLFLLRNMQLDYQRGVQFYVSRDSRDSIMTDPDKIYKKYKNTYFNHIRLPFDRTIITFEGENSMYEKIFLSCTKEVGKKYFIETHTLNSLIGLIVFETDKLPTVDYCCMHVEECPKRIGKKVGLCSIDIRTCHKCPYGDKSGKPLVAESAMVSFLAIFEVMKKFNDVTIIKKIREHKEREEKEDRTTRRELSPIHMISLKGTRFEYLDIYEDDLYREKRTNVSEGIEGASSKCEHDRLGHKRRLFDGRIIEVRPCIINPGRGRKTKIYKV